MIVATIILMEIFGSFGDNDEKNYWETYKYQILLILSWVLPF